MDPVYTVVAMGGTPIGGPEMTGAHRLYAELGFQRMPDRETYLVEGRLLYAFGLGLRLDLDLGLGLDAETDLDHPDPVRVQT